MDHEVGVAMAVTAATLTIVAAAGAGGNVHNQEFPGGALRGQLSRP